MKRKTKIIATIGPSSANQKTIKKMKDLHVNCFRINTAHGKFEEYKEWIDLARKEKDFCFMIDIKGPEIRIRTENIKIEKNQEIKFYFKESESPYFSYNFYDEVEVDDKIFFDNGLIEGIIVKKNGSSITVKFCDKALLKPNKGVNLPNKSLKIPTLSKRDKEAIEFAKKEKIDYIAVSFVRKKSDIDHVKKLLKNTEIGIISKIENQEGITNIDEIIEYSEGIMIARGDLGVEVPEERIPAIQKSIIKKCNIKSTISIVATQMLESMIDNKIPTRAEISDVANEILDGADAIMLSAETAAGKYPVRSVEVMDKVSREVEDHVKNNIDFEKTTDIGEELSKSAYYLFKRTKATKLVTPTQSGYSAALISRFRLKKIIFGLTDSHVTKRKLELMWGVRPIYTKSFPDVALVTNITKLLKKEKLVEDEEYLIYFAGIKTLKEKTSNLLEIHNIKDLLDFTKK